MTIPPAPPAADATPPAPPDARITIAHAPRIGPPTPLEAAEWLRVRFPTPEAAWSLRVLDRMAWAAGFDIGELFDAPEVRSLGLAIVSRPLYEGGQPVLCYVLRPERGG